jgi:hypothetical protein
MISGRQAIGLLVVLIGLARATLGAAPQVATTIPENGDMQVDPGLRQITVKFDQRMSRGGFSFCGGGESFPKTRGQAIWKDDRTCVLPVQLEPNHEYLLGINCPAAQNFKSRGGTPAVAVTLRFKTRGLDEGEDQQAERDWTAANHESARLLWTLVKDKYSYRDLHKVKWSQLFKRYREQLESAGTPRAFADEAAKLLGSARDLHVWLELDGEVIPTTQRREPPNMNWRAIDRLVPGYKAHGKTICSGAWTDGGEKIGYIGISSWSGSDVKAIEPALQALQRFTDYDGLIIDVRANSGGNEMLAQQFAGHFVDQPVLYGKFDLRDADVKSGFGPVQERTLEPAKAGQRFKGRVVVLSGRHVMSSCEGFLLMMKQVPGCKIIGESSYGSSGNPQSYELPNGVTVYLPIWRAMTADGERFEGIGIAPDIEVKTKPTDFMEGDPVLERALKELKSL